MRAFARILLMLMMTVPAVSAMGAPLGYSVNSDQPLGDTLYVIDLADGSANPVGVGVSALGVLRTDIEGLGIAPDLALWGIDEDQLRLFQINTTNGTVITESDRAVTGLDAQIFNDFGMTFACDGSLFVSSVTSQSLFTLDPSTGVATRVGAPGSLGVNISAIASRGSNPVRIFGLGNGLLGDEGPQDNRSLYEIDPETGAANLVGNIGAAPADYSQAGLSFDAAGNLWAITDRSQSGAFSEILSINTDTGEATVVATTGIMGFESLAIAPPGQCDPLAPGQPPEFPPRIPTLSAAGQWLGILALLLTGLIGLHRRLS